MVNNQSFSTQTHSLEENTISEIIERYKDHWSLNLIKLKNSVLANTFSFTPVSIEEVKRSIESLDPKNAAQEKDIHTNILKQNSIFFCSSCGERSMLPFLLYKKKSNLSNENYRQISILPNISIKGMKGARMIKYQNILKLDFPHFSEVFTRVIVQSTVY